MILLGPGEGEEIRPGYHIKVGREELVMTESVYAPGQRGPDLHVHRHHADAFYVLEGELHLGLGDDDLPLPAGGFALIPPMVVHGFRNAAREEARFLNFHAPGMGFDDYVRGRNRGFDQHDPPADGVRPASEAIVRMPGEGTVKAGAGDALGSLGLVEMTLEPGAGRALDSVWVLDGTLTVDLGGGPAELGAGGFAYAPSGNALSTPGDEPVRLLNITAPASPNMS
jgi:quercetin dioxygenase-like cupin family protein